MLPLNTRCYQLSVYFARLWVHKHKQGHTECFSLDFYTYCHLYSPAVGNVHMGGHTFLLDILLYWPPPQFWNAIFPKVRYLQFGAKYRILGCLISVGKLSEILCVCVYLLICL